MDYTKEHLAYCAQWLHQGSSVEGALRFTKKGLVYAVMVRENMSSHQSLYAIKFTRNSAQEVVRKMTNGSIYFVLDAFINDVWRDGKIGKQVKSNLNEGDRDLFWTIAGVEIVRQDRLRVRQDKEYVPQPLDILL